MLYFIANFPIKQFNNIIEFLGLTIIRNVALWYGLSIKHDIVCPFMSETPVLSFLTIVFRFISGN